MTKTIFLAYCWGLQVSQRRYAFKKQAVQHWPSFTEFFNLNPKDYMLFINSEFETVQSMLPQMDTTFAQIQEAIDDEAFIAAYDEWARRLLTKEAFDIVQGDSWITNFHRVVSNTKLFGGEGDPFLPELFTHMCRHDEKDAIIKKQSRNIRQEACLIKKISKRNKIMTDSIEGTRKNIEERSKELEERAKHIDGRTTVLERIHKRDEEEIRTLKNVQKEMRKKISEYEAMNLDDYAAIKEELNSLKEQMKLMTTSSVEAECVICKEVKRLGVNECGHRICSDCWMSYTDCMQIRRPCPTCKEAIDPKKFIKAIYYKKIDFFFHYIIRIYLLKN